MRRAQWIAPAVFSVAVLSSVFASKPAPPSEAPALAAGAQAPPHSRAAPPAKSTAAADLVRAHVQARFAADLAAMRTFRPGYAFWQHVFTIPDGAVAYGSGVDGRLLAIFPVTGDWVRSGVFKDVSAASVVAGLVLPAGLTDRRELVAERLETAVGPVLQNVTRGDFLRPNVVRYGGFLGEWGAIYERFGVPSEVGLSQAIVESGLSGTVRSEARAIGFCQWLLPNWNHLKRLARTPLEGSNQTTQAPFCAAYLSILATKYGTFVAALSDHHAGATNVGRTLVNGLRLGGQDIREQYFAGSELARDLRLSAPGKYSDVYGSYGPRSFRYAEMVFGNTLNVARMRTTVPQTPIYAMRATRAFTLGEIVAHSGVTADDVRRFNPALVTRVPVGANVYLPKYVKALGPDVSFWRRPAGAAYATVLNDFVRLALPADAWDGPAIAPILGDFQRRFRQTKTEEGAVMATVLAYVFEDIQTSGRAAILSDFRSNPEIGTLFERAVLERDTLIGARRLSSARTVSP